MTELYREEETYWLYKDGAPHSRSSKEPDANTIYELQVKYPTSKFTVKKEERRLTEVRSFSPLQREEKYKN